jgi:hypothetical protein
MTNQGTSTFAKKDLPEDKMLENAIEDICRFAAKLKHGKQNDEQIQKRLTDAGLSIEAARTVTQMGTARIGKDRRAGLRNLLFGALWLGAGMLTLAALNAASASGGYWIVYGAVLIGVVQILFGFIQLLRAPRGQGEIRDIVKRITPTIQAEEASRWKIAAIKIHNP